MGTYPVIFLLRRSFFVIITFTMLELPSLQVHTFIVSALLYLCYIAQQRFHDSLMQQRIEVFNEVLLLCLCYHFVLFADDVWEEGERDQFGQSTNIFICVLLGVNALIILAVNFKAV